MQTFPDEVVVKGFPWHQTVCVRGTDHLRSKAGELVYENRFVIWGHLSWGLLRDYEVYEDTPSARLRSTSGWPTTSPRSRCPRRASTAR